PALLPRAADPAQRARAHVPRRTVGSALRPATSAADQPRRHPRVLPTGPGGRRGRASAAVGVARPGDPWPARRERPAVLARWPRRVARFGGAVGVEPAP